MRIAATIVLTAVSAGASIAADKPPVPSRQELARQIDAYTAPFDRIGHLSGNLLVARGDEVVYERSFGMANVELRVRNGPDTRFNVASITKPMTKIAMIQLAIAGKLSLADPVSKWIPDFPRGSTITIEHLARHRAGIPHRVTERSDEVDPKTAAEVVALAARKPLEFEPGDHESYSSGGYTVLARVLELAGGESYGSLVRRYVFEPVGMPRSAHVDSRQIVPDRASPYLLDTRGERVNAPLEDFSFLVGAGSVVSTARDLHALVRAIRQGKLGEGPRQSFGNEDGIEFNGQTSGFRAFADWHAKTDITVVFLGNLLTGAADSIRRDVPRLAAGETVAPPEPPRTSFVAVRPEVLRSYEGVYELRPGTRLRVHAEDAGLRVDDWALAPTGERTFLSFPDYGVVEVVLDEKGQPLRLDWRQGEATYPCPRVADLER
jgi:CubicO group peptidase (beta-lactamase class C family)